MNKQIKYIFRLVHILNIPHILKYGIVSSSSPNKSEKYVPIGDDSLIVTRKDQLIPDTTNRIGDFIPFYFGTKTPMLFTIQNGYNNVKKQKPEDIVYCVVRIDDIIEKGLTGYFTDGHARSANTQFYSLTQLPNLHQYVRSEDVYRTQWGNDVDNTGEWKRMKSAEVLLANDLPISLVCGYVVYNSSAREKLLAYGVSDNQIIIRENYYF